MKPEFRLEDKSEYCSYISCYVDGILCIHHHPDDVLNKLNGCVLLKPSSVRRPDMYHGMKLKCMQLHNGICALSMMPSNYVQEAVRIYEEHVAKHLSKVYRLPKRAKNPFTIGYCPNLEVSLRHLITSP